MSPRARRSRALRRRSGAHAERRRRIRFRVTLPIRIRTADGEITGQTRNISLLGASAITAQPAPDGIPATAEVDLPSGGTPIRMEGTIVRSIPLDLPNQTQYEVGVFALRFQDRDETRLSQYLDHLQMAEYAAIKAGYKALQLKIRQRKARQRALLLAKRRRRARRRARLRRRAAAAARRRSRRRG